MITFKVDTAELQDHIEAIGVSNIKAITIELHSYEEYEDSFLDTKLPYRVKIGQDIEVEVC